MKTKIIISIVLLVFSSWAVAQNLNLDALKMNSVSISGHVTTPGTYKVTRVDRISDLIILAMLDLDSELPQRSGIPEDTDILKKTHPIPNYRVDSKDEEVPMQGLRHVKLLRSGQSTEYDLLSFYRRGDISQNPILRDGDHVHIPLAAETIEILGAVGMPGELEYREGDTIKDVIDLALGTLPGADLSTIQLSLYQASEAEYLKQSLDLVVDPEHYAQEVSPRSIVMVPQSRYHSRRKVSISGEVALQGDYMISHATGIWDIIEMAGGLTEDADLDNAVIMNMDYNAAPDLEFERLRQSPMTNLSPIEYSYLRSKIRQAKGRYSVDFQRIIDSKGEEGDIPLQDNDYIYIPQKLNMIWVSGQVRNPGLVPYQEGESWRYYIEQAGGYANNRNSLGIRLMRGGSGNWVKVRKNMDLNPGDMIFVPDKLDRSLWEDLKDIIGLTASAITILIGVQSLTK